MNLKVQQRQDVDMGTRFCRVVEQHPGMSNATARIGAWLVAVQMEIGSPVTVSYRQIRDGFSHGESPFLGTGSRTETVKASMLWLEEHGYVKCSEGPATRESGWLPCKNYTMVV